MPKRIAKRQEPAPPKKPGAPLIEIDMDQLASLCRLKPTKEDVAAFFQCSHDTIERRIHESFGISFKEFRDQHLVHSKFDLIRQALSLAKLGDTDMLKFCLKNLSNWTDRGEAPAVDVNITNNVAVKVQQTDIEERIELFKDK